MSNLRALLFSSLPSSFAPLPLFTIGELPSKLLPEEAVNHRIVVPEATREMFLQQLRASSVSMLSLLNQIAGGPLGAEVMVQVR